MIKKMYIPLLLCSLVAPITQARAGFTEGLAVGGFVGLTSALIGSAIAKNCSGPDVIVYEQPVVYYEQPAVVYEPCVYYEPHVVCNRPYRQKTRVRKQALPKKQEVVKQTIVETRVVTPKSETTDAEIKKRELALKERQIELDLIKEKKELLREENRKKELTLTEQKLEKKEEPCLAKA